MPSGPSSKVLYWWGLVITQIQFAHLRGENGLSPISHWHLETPPHPAVLMSSGIPQSPLWPVTHSVYLLNPCFLSIPLFRGAKRALCIHLHFQACICNQIRLSNGLRRPLRSAPHLPSQPTTFVVHHETPCPLTSFLPAPLNVQMTFSKRGPGRRWRGRGKQRWRAGGGREMLK